MCLYFFLCAGVFHGLLHKYISCFMVVHSHSESLLMIHLAIWGRLTFDINVEHFVQPHKDLHNDDDGDDHWGLARLNRLGVVTVHQHGLSRQLLSHDTPRP